MKTFLRSTALIIFLLLASARVSAQEEKTVQKAVIQTAITCDHCKACGSCGGLLEKKLLKNKGIQMITLDEKKMTIEVIYNSKKTNLTAIRTAISKLGYDADDIKADPEAYKKLDGCCKTS